MGWAEIDNLIANFRKFIENVLPALDVYAAESFELTLGLSSTNVSPAYP
jgi:hypothetical protein